MGLGDRYAYTVKWRWVDITGLRNEWDRLVARMAGPDVGIIESDATNNDS